MRRLYEALLHEEAKHQSAPPALQDPTSDAPDTAPIPVDLPSDSDVHQFFFTLAGLEDHWTEDHAWYLLINIRSTSIKAENSHIIFFLS